MAGSVRAPSGQIEPTAYYGPEKVTPKTEAAQEDAKAKRKDHREETPDKESKSSGDGASSNSEVHFKVKEGSKGPVIQFVDSATGDVTRQVPTEDVLKAAKKLGALAGLFFEKEG